MLDKQRSNPSDPTKSKILLGRVYHLDAKRSADQLAQCEILKGALIQGGFEVETRESHHQVEVAPSTTASPQDYVAVARDFWAQEMHHLRESKRRRGGRGPVTLKKRWRAAKRLSKLLQDPEGVKRARARGRIEVALSHKHLHLWRCLANSDAFGAVIVEDDFSLRDASSGKRIVQLLSQHGHSVDLLDLAGGFSREQLGISDRGKGDLTLSFLLANTTCGYFISRVAASRLVDVVASNPRLTRLGSDFLIEVLNEDSFCGTSLLPADLPMIHGSLEGFVDSSIPY